MWILWKFPLLFIHFIRINHFSMANTIGDCVKNKIENPPRKISVATRFSPFYPLLCWNTNASLFYVWFPIVRLLFHICQFHSSRITCAPNMKGIERIHLPYESTYSEHMRKKLPIKIESILFSAKMNLFKCETKLNDIFLLAFNSQQWIASMISV